MKKVKWNRRHVWGTVLLGLTLTACGGGGSGGGEGTSIPQLPLGEYAFEGAVTANLTDGNLSRWILISNGATFGTITYPELSINSSSGGLTKIGGGTTSGIELLYGAVGDIRGTADYAIGAWRAYSPFLGGGQFRNTRSDLTARTFSLTQDGNPQYLITKFLPAFPVAGSLTCGTILASTRPAELGSGPSAANRNVSSAQVNVTFTGSNQASITAANITLTLDTQSVSRSLTAGTTLLLTSPTNARSIGGLPPNAEGVLMSFRVEGGSIIAIMAYSLLNPVDSSLYYGFVVLGCQ